MNASESQPQWNWLVKTVTTTEVGVAQLRTHNGIGCLNSIGYHFLAGIVMFFDQAMIQDNPDSL